MIEPFDESRITLRPLTAAAAEDTGHILWVEADNAPDALRQMYLGLLKAPFNCAVWANAGDQISPEARSDLRAWRAAHGVELYSDLLSSGNYRGGLKKLFAEAAVPGTEWLENHTRDLATGVFNGFATRFIRTRIRASDTRTTLPGYHDAHADGPSRWPHTRVLQALECAPTWLIDNRDAVRRAVTEDDARKLSQYLNEPLEKSMAQVGAVEWMMRQDKPVTLWEPPANSVAMISTASHHCQPILHSMPATRPGQEPEKRTVVIHDCRLLM